MRLHKVSVLMVEGPVRLRVSPKVSTRIDAFAMRYVGVGRRDAQSDKNGVIG